MIREMEEVAKIMEPFEKQPKPNAAEFPYTLSWKLDFLEPLKQIH